MTRLDYFFFLEFGTFLEYFMLSRVLETPLYYTIAEEPRKTIHIVFVVFH